MALGRGSYVKVVDREGKEGTQIYIVGTIGTQREASEV